MSLACGQTGRAGDGGGEPQGVGPVRGQPARHIQSSSHSQSVAPGPPGAGIIPYWEPSPGWQLHRNCNGPVYHSHVTRARQSWSLVYPPTLTACLPLPGSQGIKVEEHSRTRWAPLPGRSRAWHPCFGLLGRTCPLFLVMVIVPTPANKPCPFVPGQISRGCVSASTFPLLLPGGLRGWGPQGRADR